MAHRRSCILTLLAATMACGGGEAPTTPSTPAPPTAIALSLFGSVREWPTARAIAGATVSIVDGPNAGNSSTTNALGDYRLTGLQEGEFTVVVSAPDHTPHTSRVTLTSNRRLDFQLRHEGAPYEVVGTVNDEDGRPLAGAAVLFDFVSPDVSSRFSQLEVRTDAAGLYRMAFTAVPAGYAGSAAFARAAKDGHESDHRWFRAETPGARQTLNFRLYRIRRITAGEATTITISPDDSLCYNNVRDSPGIGPGYVCRTVRVLAPADGVMTIEAISIATGTHPSVAVETVNASPFVWRFENPTSLPVVVGTEVKASIEMAAGSPVGVAVMLTTAMAPN